MAMTKSIELNLLEGGRDSLVAGARPVATAAAPLDQVPAEVA